MKDDNWKWILIIFVIALSVWYAYPLEEKIKLGIDLKGGMHLVLEVEAEAAVENRLSQYAGDIRRAIEKEDIDLKKIKANGQKGVEITLYDQDDTSKVKDILRDYQTLEFDKLTNSNTTLNYTISDNEVDNIKKGAVDQALETIRNRIDEFGVSEPTIQKGGKRRIIIQLPGISDTERAIKLIGRTAVLEFKLVDNKNSLDDAMTGNMSDGLEILYKKIKDPVTGQELSKTPFLLESETLLTGDRIKMARVNIDTQYNEPYVGLEFDKIGTRLFGEVTKKNIGRHLAIILDGNVYSAPNIKDAITGGNAQISGGFTLNEAKDLAIVLRAGSLPAPVTIIENRTVGPSLGRDSINKGVMSILIGGILVLLFMPVYYKLSGAIASLVLIVNLVLMLGALAAFKATLTLPGIAGIILTIGMAVDANVLIFERIREELRIGASVRSSVNIGFSKAFITIVDANVTTLIAAIILFQFGTGPIKGFAVTLGIGIIASMFTACFASKVIFDTMLKKKNVKSLSI